MKTALFKVKSLRLKLKKIYIEKRIILPYGNKKLKKIEELYCPTLLLCRTYLHIFINGSLLSFRYVVTFKMTKFI